MKEPKYAPTVLEQAIELYDRHEQESQSKPNTPGKRGGVRAGAGRKTAFGDAETAQYMLPKKWARESQEYARVALAKDGGSAPMECRDGRGVMRMQLPKGHGQLMADVIGRWEDCGVTNVPTLSKGYPLPEADNVVLEYTDVTNLVEIVREYAYSAGYAEATRDAMK